MIQPKADCIGVLSQLENGSLVGARIEYDSPLALSTRRTKAHRTYKRDIQHMYLYIIYNIRNSCTEISAPCNGIFHALA